MFKKTMMVIIVALCMMSIVNVANADYFGYEDNGAQTLDYVNFDDGTIFTVNMTDGTLSYDSWGMGIYNTQVVSEGVIGVDPESKLCIFDNETSGTMTTLQFVDNGYGAYNVTTGFGETAIVEETFGIYFTYTENDVDYTIYSHNSLNDPEADWFEIYAVGGDTSIIVIPDTEIIMLFSGATPTQGGPYGAPIPIGASHILLASGCMGLMALRKRN